MGGICLTKHVFVSDTRKFDRSLRQLMESTFLH